MEIITLFGLLLALAGLFVPSLISSHSSRKAELRERAEPVMQKLLSEIEAIKGGSYPFRSIKKTDLHKLYLFVGRRRRRALDRAYNFYIEGHSIAKTRHWHDDHHAGLVFFPASFTVENPDEVLKKFRHLEKELSR